MGDISVEGKTMPSDPLLRSSSGPWADGGPRLFRAMRREQAAPPVRPPLGLVSAALLSATLVVIGGIGPWLYSDRGSQGTETLYGWQTDGVLAIAAALVAAIALVVLAVRPSAGIAAWVSFGALAICAVNGVLNWIDLSAWGDGEPDEYVFDVLWGVETVAVAGLAGACCAFLIARRVNRY